MGSINKPRDNGPRYLKIYNLFKSSTYRTGADPVIKVDMPIEFIAATN